MAVTNDQLIKALRTVLFRMNSGHWVPGVADGYPVNDDIDKEVLDALEDSYEKDPKQ